VLIAAFYSADSEMSLSDFQILEHSFYIQKKPLLAGLALDVPFDGARG
jgi:hypothetical protein